MAQCRFGRVKRDLGAGTFDFGIKVALACEVSRRTCGLVALQSVRACLL